MKGATVLDIGCGLGGLCIDIALSGAKKVIGIDIAPKSIEIACENIKRNYPYLCNIIEFVCDNLSEYSEECIFDYIVSKNSFEHIIPLGEMLNEMKKRLKPGGKIYVGFGPLYNSPNGAHMKKVVIPWGHLLIPDVVFSKILSFEEARTIHTVKDLALNRWPYSEYQNLFKKSGLSILYYRTNRGSNKLYKIFTLLAKIPFLKEYCTLNLYCILEKISEY